MAPEDMTQGQSFPQAMGTLARRGAGDVVAAAPQMLASMIPGAGLAPAVIRAGMVLGGGGLSEMAGQGVRGEEIDPTQAFSASGMSAAVGLPFEAGAALFPKAGPRILSDVLRPRGKRQMEAELVARRQSGAPGRAPADYERLGRQMAAERIRPSIEGEQTLIDKGAAVNQSVDDILDQATAAGHVVLPTTLARSPEIAALRKEAAKELNPAAAEKAINNILKAFVRGRTSPMTPSELASPNPSRLGQKQVWRREANVINKAREAGTSTDKVQGMEARVSDALARAAKREVEGLPFTTADPENPSAQIGAGQLNERLEGRIPLEGAIRDFNMRPPLSVYERYGLLRGRLPISENWEGGIGLALSDPNYARDLLLSRGVVGAAAQDLTRRATKPQ
jgi:hypothetical protein